jgi:hypothetical protein
MLYNAYCKGFHVQSIARGTHPKTRQKPTKQNRPVRPGRAEKSTKKSTFQQFCRLFERSLQKSLQITANEELFEDFWGKSGE